MAHSLEMPGVQQRHVHGRLEDSSVCIFDFWLFAVQKPEVNFLVWRTAVNQLLLLCTSSGWSSKPLVSILDWRRSRLPTLVEPEVLVQADGLFSVSMRVNIEEVHGNSEMAETFSICGL